jgi:hypothetical protein
VRGHERRGGVEIDIHRRELDIPARCDRRELDILGGSATVPIKNCTDSEGRTMFSSQLGTHLASTVASDLATSALPDAPVRRPADRRPARRLRRRP